MKVISRRNLMLDIIRFVAVLLVFFHHTLIWKNAPKFPAALLRGGGSGVDLFFVLSGFLIGGLLFLELKRYGRIELGRFYIRRGLKIYPAFYVMIAATMAVHQLNHLPFPETRALLGELLFLQNYVGRMRGHTWSLAIEEHFYIFLPLVLTALNASKRFSLAAIVWIYPLCATLTLCGRLLTSPLEAMMLPTHLRADSLLCGVLLAYFYHFHETGFRQWTTLLRVPLIIVGTSAFVVPMIYDMQTMPLHWAAFIPLLLSLGSASLIAGALSLTLESGWIWRTIAFIGAFSYSIYLFHLTLFNVGESVANRLHLGQSFIAVPLFQYTAAIAGGILIGKLIEVPALRIRDRLFPSRTGSPVQGDGEASQTDQPAISPTKEVPNIIHV